MTDPCAHEYRVTSHKLAPNKRSRIALLTCLLCGSTTERITARNAKQLDQMIATHDAQANAAAAAVEVEP